MPRPGARGAVWPTESSPPRAGEAFPGSDRAPADAPGADGGTCVRTGSGPALRRLSPGEREARAELSERAMSPPTGGPDPEARRFVGGSGRAGTHLHVSRVTPRVKASELPSRRDGTEHHREGVSRSKGQPLHGAGIVVDDVRSRAAVRGKR